VNSSRTHDLRAQVALGSRARDPTGPGKRRIAGKAANQWFVRQCDECAMTLMKSGHVCLIVVLATVALPFAALRWTYIGISTPKGNR
jgi:hypothetical protein